MRGSTYRYFTGGPLFPFGYGLSYTKFVYSNLRFESKSVKAGEAVKVSADVMNAGERAARKGSIVSHRHEGICAVQIRILVGFERISLRPKEKVP